MIPVGARLGIGAFATAWAASALQPGTAAIAAVVATASAALVAQQLVGGRRRPRPSRLRPRPDGLARGAIAGIVGAWLVVARLLVGGDGSPVGGAILPDGRGPWIAQVVAVGTPRDGQQRLTVALDEPTGLLLAAAAPRYPAVEPGDRVELTGTPEAPPDGGYGDYLRRIGVAGTLRSRSLERLGRDGGAASLLERTRRAAGDALARALPEPAAGLAAGILVGLRDRVDRDLAAAFTATGLSHVVAISGWNIALVAGLVGALLAGRARRTRSGAILLAIVAYTVLAGASASVVRAAAMAGVALVARESGRPGTAAAALGWAVAILVLAVPANAADVGLQLSAAATAGLVAWSRPTTAFLERRAGRLPGWVREGLGVSLAAQAATLPIVILAFGRLAPLSPLTNLAVVPLVPPAMAAGTLALAGGAVEGLGVPPPIAAVVGIPAAIVLGVLIGIVRLAAGLPLASLELPPAVAGGAAVLVALGVVAVAERRRLDRWAAARPGRRAWHRDGAGGAAVPGTSELTRTRTGGSMVPRSREPAPGSTVARRALRLAGIAAALGAAVLVVAAAARPDGRVHVVVLDVGQGDAILVTGPTGGRLLVDGGPDPDRLLVALDARVPPWDRRIDLVVLTHPHEDHVAGLPLVLERYRVGRVAEPGMPGGSPGYEALAALLAGRGTAPARLAAGDRFEVDGIAVDVLWPDADRVPGTPSDEGSEVNDASIVLLGTFEGRRFLLTGDAEADVEAILAARGLPAVDVLKAGHHGSRTSTTDALVDATRPRVVAVSVGTGNDYGHPSREVLDRLAAAGAIVLRTDEVGTIDVALDAGGVEVRTTRPLPGQGADGAGLTRYRAAAAVATCGDGGVATSAARTVPAALGRAGGLPYDRPDVGPIARGRRRPPRLARPARMAPPARPGRRRGRGLARGALRRRRRTRGPGARRGRRAASRRRQGASRRRPGPGPPARAGVGGVALRPRPRRARGPDRGPPGHAPDRAGDRGGRVARHGAPRGARRRVRGQARRPAPRADDGAIRPLAPPLPGGLVGRQRHPRPAAGRCARANGVHPRGRHPGRGASVALDRPCPCRGPGSGGGRRVTGPALGYFWGDDEYGLERAAIELGRRAAGPGGEPPAAWRRAGSAIRAGEVAERIATATLFGGGTLVIVEEPGPLVRSKADRDALVAAIGTLAPGNALAFVETVDGSARRLKSLEDLAAAVAAAGGEVRPIVAPREGGMARWIEERADELGMRLERGAAEALARKVGAFVREGDVDRRRQGRLAVAELEKLAVYRVGSPVRPEDVEALVADAVPGSTWAFLDAVGSRRAREAADHLERLLETTPEPVLVAVLHRRIRELLQVLDHRERGDSLQVTARALKLKEYPARKLWDQGLAWRLDELTGALEGLLELDATLKGDGAADARRRRLAFALWLAERVQRG